jgi:hypothetical protein
VESRVVVGLVGVEVREDDAGFRGGFAHVAEGFRVVYASDEVKAARVLQTIRENPGITKYKLWQTTAINAKLLGKLLDDLGAKGKIECVIGLRGGHHYRAVTA